jgi:hypothetical protein
MVSIRTTWYRTRSRLKIHSRCWLFVGLLIPTTATAADARPSPHRHIPAKNLVAYFEFDGLDAHADAWNRTATHAALVKTKAGAMISELAKQAAEWLLKDWPPFTGADLIAVHEHLIRHGFEFAVYTNGRGAYLLTCVVNDFGNQKLHPRLKHVNQAFEFLMNDTKIRIRGRDVYMIDDGAEPGEWRPVEEPFPLPLLKKPANVRAAAPWFASWFEGNNLILVAGQSEAMNDVPDPNGSKTLARAQMGLVAAILDTTNGRQPNVETHASYKAAITEGNDLKGFEAVGLFFMQFVDGNSLKITPPVIAAGPDVPLVDKDLRQTVGEVVDLPPVFTENDLALVKHETPSVRPLPDVTLETKRKSGETEDTLLTPAQIAALGLNETKGVIVRFGFQGEAFLTDLRIEAPSPRKGINAWFDQPSFRKNQLPPLQGVSTFAVGSLDLDKTYQSLLELSSSLDPSVSEDLRHVAKIVHEYSHVRLRENLLRLLGPTLCVYLAPVRPGDRTSKDKSDPTAYVFLAGLKDAVAFGKSLDMMVTQFNEDLAPDHADIGQKPGDRKSSSCFLEKLPAPESGYRLTASAAAKLGLAAGVQPTIIMGKSFVAVAATPELAREALASEAREDHGSKPTGKLVHAFEGLPGDVTFLGVADHRDSHVPHWIAKLPGLTQLPVNMSQEEDLDNASPWSLLDMFCLPSPGRFHVKFDKTRIPEEDDLSPFLFPSVLAATVDERGLRFISRGAFPLALLANNAAINYYFFFGWTNYEGFRFKETLDVRVFGLDPSQL